LANVLVKVSGDRNLLENPALKPILKQASGLVQQYQYKSMPVTSEEHAAEGTPQRFLWARFDPKAVDRLLRESGFPAWGMTRPSLLVWLGQESGTRRELISPEMDIELKEYLDQVATSRGVPLVWPLMDIEDQNAIQVSDLWGGFEEDIRSASNRYLPDVILVGQLSKRGRGSWLGEWFLYLPDHVHRWQTSESSREEMAREGFQQAIDVLVQRYAPQQANQGVASLKLRVFGLARLADYALVQDYLRSLAMVERVDLSSVDSERIDFILQVHGGRESLKRGIQLGAVLEPVVISREMTASPEDMEEMKQIDHDSLNYRLR
jgi:hypothetical protein